jgi:hypothetical protein
MRRFLYAVSLSAVLCIGVSVRAQDDEVSLGDLARSVRKPTPADAPVIDNDNLSVMMDKAESERLNGKPVFSIDPSGKTFRMTSPDGTCSLSFDARAGSLISTPYVASDVPAYEMLKLEGPATISDGVLEVSLHNGTAWELKEIVVGITVLRESGAATLKAAALSSSPAESNVQQKLPDLTLLYHLKATAAPDSTTLFRGNLGDDLSQAKDWHWALVGARGVPPAAGTPAQLDGSAPISPLSTAATPTANIVSPSATDLTKPAEPLSAQH